MNGQWALFGFLLIIILSMGCIGEDAPVQTTGAPEAEAISQTTVPPENTSEDTPKITRRPLGSAYGISGPILGTEAPETTPPPTTPQPTPEPTVEPIIEGPPKGAVALFFKTSLGGEAERLAGSVTGVGASGQDTIIYDINWDTQKYGIFRYIPSTKQLTNIKETSSPSYASHSLIPRTDEGRLILVDEYSTQTVFSELDPRDKDSLNYFSIQKDLSHMRLASVGSMLYYIHEGLNVYDMNTRQVTNLLDTSHPDYYFGSLYSAGGKLYSIRQLGDDLWFDERNPATGAITSKIGRFVFQDAADYVWRFAVDESGVYWARQRQVDYVVQGPVVLSKLALSGGDPVDLIEITSDPGEEFGLQGIDAHGGYVVINLQTRPYNEADVASDYIYDDNTGETQDINLGLKAKWMEILILE